MKNYYEILEVDKNASQEVIEKAYRALAKKYHPDLQQGAQKDEYAEKMKVINAAYDVLSNNEKREEYNNRLAREANSEQERILRENMILKEELNRKANQQVHTQADRGSVGNMAQAFNQQIQEARRQAYYDAYLQDLRRRGYKIRYKHSFMYYIKLIIAIAIVIFACFLIYQIPFVKNYFQDLYNENQIFSVIVDIIRETISTDF